MVPLGTTLYFIIFYFSTWVFSWDVKLTSDLNIYLIINLIADRRTKVSWRNACRVAESAWRKLTCSCFSKAWSRRTKKQHSLEGGARCCLSSCTRSWSSLCSLLPSPYSCPSLFFFNNLLFDICNAKWHVYLWYFLFLLSMVTFSCW